MVIQSDCNEFILEEEIKKEVANLCLMAHENELYFKNSQDFILEEMQEAFYKLIIDLNLLDTKNKDFKK